MSPEDKSFAFVLENINSEEIVVTGVDLNASQDAYLFERELQSALALASLACTFFCITASHSSEHSRGAEQTKLTQIPHFIPRPIMRSPGAAGATDRVQTAFTIAPGTPPWPGSSLTVDVKPVYVDGAAIGPTGFGVILTSGTTSVTYLPNASGVLDGAPLSFTFTNGSASESITITSIADGRQIYPYSPTLDSDPAKSYNVVLQPVVSEATTDAQYDRLMATPLDCPLNVYFQETDQAAVRLTASVGGLVVVNTTNLADFNVIPVVEGSNAVVSIELLTKPRPGASVNLALQEKSDGGFASYSLGGIVYLDENTLKGSSLVTTEPGFYATGVPMLRLAYVIQSADSVDPIYEQFFPDADPVAEVGQMVLAIASQRYEQFRPLVGDLVSFTMAEGDICILPGELINDPYDQVMLQTDFALTDPDAPYTTGRIQQPLSLLTQFIQSQHVLVKALPSDLVGESKAQCQSL